MWPEYVGMLVVPSSVCMRDMEETVMIPDLPELNLCSPKVPIVQNTCLI